MAAAGASRRLRNAYPNQPRSTYIYSNLIIYRLKAVTLNPVISLDWHLTIAKS